MIEKPEDGQSEDEITNLTPSTPERDTELQEWCLLLEAPLPFSHLGASDGSIKPITIEEMEELRNHQPRHLSKSHLCKVT